MKNLTLLIFALLFIQLTAFSQSCLPEGITFQTQTQIDSFQINYPDCTEIEGDVTIYGSQITNLNGLNVLTSIGGRVQIGKSYFGGSVLSNLTGLEGLTSIGGDLVIHCNDALTSLTGLDNVTSIEGSVQIGNYLYTGNTALTSLTGLEGLTSIGGDLMIGGWRGGNPALTSLTGLDNIDAASIDDLRIVGNMSLSTCEVQSVCDYLANPSGTTSIYDNAPGCNSQEEVEEACWVSVEEIRFEEKFTISPNPLESSTLIQYTLHHKSPVTLKILDLSGQEIATLINEFQQQGEHKVVFKGNGLRPGIYFCVLKTSERMQTKKIIKL
jgi:hypothetical protein